MDDQESVQVSAERLRSFCLASLEASGLPRAAAELTADTLVKAELRGVGSHGLIRLPFYCQRLLLGGTNPKPGVKIVADKPAMVLVDGDNGQGQVVSVKAMKLAIERARAQGSCFVGVRNSCHFGMAAYYSLMAVEAGMIGISACNSSPIMTAWGGGRPAIGNNPLTIAVPAALDFPLVLDMAMSVVSAGRVRLEGVKGRKIPGDWILDAKGRPTDDPNDFNAGGTLLPLGYKGFGLAVMIEVLSGVLTQAGVLSAQKTWFKAPTEPINTGHFFLTLDISTFMDLEAFKKGVAAMAKELKSSPLMEGSSGIFMPGEMEHQKEKAYLKGGIPVPTGVLRSLDDLADRLNLGRLER